MEGYGTYTWWNYWSLWTFLRIFELGLECPGHPRDPEEDMEQMRYLSEQIRKRAARKKSKKNGISR